MHALLHDLPQARRHGVGHRLRVRADAQAVQALAQGLFAVRHRRELQQEAQLVVELERTAHLRGRLGLDPLHRGRRWWRGLLQVGGQRLDPVAGLDALDVGDVRLRESLGPAADADQVGLGPDHLGESLRRGALPARAGHQEPTAAVASGTTADVGKVVAIQVRQLQREIAPGLHRRHADDDRFGPQVEHGRGRGRIDIGRGGRVVVGRDGRRGVAEGIERAFVLRAALVDVGGIDGLVAGHHGVAVQVGFLGDATRFGRRHAIDADELRSRGRIRRGEAAAAHAGGQRQCGKATDIRGRSGAGGAYAHSMLQQGEALATPEWRQRRGQDRQALKFWHISQP